MHPATDPSTTPIYGVRPSKPGLYLGLFHGRDTPNQTMHDWGFDGPAIGPLRYFHTTYACSVNVEFVSPTDAQLFTGTHDTLMDLAINGDLLCFDGKLYGDWTVYWVSPEECHRPLDTFRQNTRPNDLRRQAKPIPWDEDNPGNWNVGHVVLAQKKAHILLVTLNKQGRADEHKYMDHWIDDTHFHWQSQNATDPTSKRGDDIIRHAALGIDIHLFVRDAKLAAGKTASFTYHGRVRYQSQQGSRPMSIVYGLDTAMGSFAGRDLPSLWPNGPNGL